MVRHKDSALSSPWRSRTGISSEAFLLSALLIIPLLIGLAWGAYFDDSAYVTFRQARNLAYGRGQPRERIRQSQYRADHLCTR